MAKSYLPRQAATRLRKVLSSQSHRNRKLPRRASNGLRVTEGAPEWHACQWNGVRARAASPSNKPQNRALHAVVQIQPEALPCTGVQNEQCPINPPGKVQKTGLATGEDHYKLLVQDQVRAESPQYLSALRVSFLHHRRWDSNQPPITCGHIPSLPRELGSPFHRKPATPRFSRRDQKKLKQEASLTAV